MSPDNQAGHPQCLLDRAAINQHPSGAPHPDHNVISRRNHEITNQQVYFSPELHQDSLERPLLYTVVVRNDESYGNDFFKPNERQRARRVLLTIPAERESVRGGSRATNANGEGTIRGVVTAR